MPFVWGSLAIPFRVMPSFVFVILVNVANFIASVTPPPTYCHHSHHHHQKTLPLPPDLPRHRHRYNRPPLLLLLIKSSNNFHFNSVPFRPAQDEWKLRIILSWQRACRVLPHRAKTGLQIATICIAVFVHNNSCLIYYNLTSRKYI